MAWRAGQTSAARLTAEQRSRKAVRAMEERRKEPQDQRRLQRREAWLRL